MKVGDLVSINSQRQVFKPRAYYGRHGQQAHRAHGHPETHQEPSKMDAWVEGAHWEPIQGTGVIVRISSHDIIEVSMVDTGERYAVKAGGVEIISEGGKK
jgi:hypothetical protein